MTDHTYGTGTSIAYVRHPAADTASGWLYNGQSLDAGTGMLVTQNISALHRESARHLVSDIGPGALSYDKDFGWTTFSDEVIPNASERTGSHQHIAWNRGMARRYGPLLVLADRIDSSGEPRARKVRCCVRAYSDGVTVMPIYVAATATDAPPSDAYLAFATCTVTSATAADYGKGTSMSGDDLDLDFALVGVRPTARACGPTTDAGAGVVDVAQVWLWLGWAPPASATLGILAFSAWELAPG